MGDKVISKNSRKSGIELLRILVMMGVIILHYNSSEIGGALKTVSFNSVNYYILMLLETVSIGAVDMFILISGYFLCNTQDRKVVKALELILQVMVINVAIYFARVAMGTQIISMKGIIVSLVPNNYFVILYIVLYFISPYINLAIKNLNEKQFLNMVILGVVLFSLWPTLVDLLGEISGREWEGLSSVGMYGSQKGFTIVNFCLMYIIGAFLQKYKLKKIFNKTSSNLAIWFLSTVFILMWAVLNDRFTSFGLRSAWEYCNPIVIIQVISLFQLFRNINISSKIVNSLAKGAFTCFLVQNVLIKNIANVGYFVNKPFYIMVAHIASVAIIIYLLSYIVYIVYSVITRPIFSKLQVIINNQMLKKGNDLKSII